MLELFTRRLVYTVGYWTWNYFDNMYRADEYRWSLALWLRSGRLMDRVWRPGVDPFGCWLLGKIADVWAWHEIDVASWLTRHLCQPLTPAERMALIRK
jgi:hypothetical protein